MDPEQLRRSGLDPRYYDIVDGHIVRTHPDQCPAGHVLTEPDAQPHPCDCTVGEARHLTWPCPACGAVWTLPRCTRHPQWVLWPGIDTGPTEVWATHPARHRR